MGWVMASLGSAVLFAGVSVLDKRILAVHVPGLLGFYFLLGVIQVAMAMFVAVAGPWESGASGEAVAAAMVSGTLWGGGLMLFFYGLRVLEVSRVAPIFHISPVFVAIMAVFLLDERLLLVHWLAIFAVVSGAGLVMLGQDQSKTSRRTTLAFALVFLASIITAAATVASKVALEEMNFWNVFAFRSLFLGVVFLIPAVRLHGLRQAKAVLADRRGAGLILLTEGVLAPIAVYAMLLALSLGPASLASTLMSTRPVFVLIISALLSTRFWHVLDEPLTRDALALKAVSAAMVVGGVSVLSLV
ncbi:EamA family transporter [Chloroflexota bacterium]